MIKTNLIILITLVQCIYLSAQSSLDIFTIAGDIGQPTEYIDTAAEKVQEISMYLNLKAPVPLNDKNIWFNDISYYQYNLSNSITMPAHIANPIKVHGIILQSGLIRVLNDKNRVFLFAIPRLMSDLKSVDSKDFQFGALALFEHKYSDNLTMRYGATINKEFFGPYLVPLVYMDWHFHEKWQFSGLLPIYSKLAYLASDKLSLGIHHLGLITSYRLNGEHYKNNYIERNHIVLNYFTRYRITDNIHTEIRIGYTVSRSYEQYATDDKVSFGMPLVTFGDDRNQLNYNFESGVTAQLRLVYNISLED